MYEVAERVKAYQSAVQAEDVVLQQSLASIIVSEARLHHGAVLRENLPGGGLWQQIRKDAKVYDFEMKMATMNLDQQAAYRVVADYIEARSACGKAWGEVFASKALAKAELPSVGFKKTRLFRAENQIELGGWTLSQEQAEVLAEKNQGKVFYVDVYDLKAFNKVADKEEFIADSAKAKNLILSKQEVPSASKQTADFDEKAFFNAVNPAIRVYTERRDQLAHQILDNPSHYLDAMLDLKVDLNKIMEQSDAHSRAMLVGQYKMLSPALIKGQLQPS